MNSGTLVEGGAAAAAAIFAREGLVPPPLPSLKGDLLACGESCFATRQWSGFHTLADAVQGWFASPSDDGALLGFSGHGIRSTGACLFTGTPQLGVFLQKLWAHSIPGETETNRLRIAGSFGLAQRVLATAERVIAAGRWPAGRRLVLIDDDFGRLGWGWVGEGDRALPPLTPGPMTYLDVLDALDALDGTGPGPGRT